MYEVGQTIYTILEDKYKVVPLKVSEQIVTKETVTVGNKYFMPKEDNVACNIDPKNNIINSLPPPQKEPDDKIKVDLGDGVTANLNINSIESVLDQKKNEHITS